MVTPHCLIVSLLVIAETIQTSVTNYTAFKDFAKTHQNILLYFCLCFCL